MPGRMTRRGAALALAAAAAGCFAAIVRLTGGFDTRIGGVPLRSRSWERPASIALVLAIAAVVVLRREIVAAALSFGRPARRRPRQAAIGVAVLAACWAAFAGVRYGTFAAGGADSYGYVSQATLLRQGRLTSSVSIDRAFTWPYVTATLTPLGYVPRARDSIAPVYPPGLPLLMAPLTVVSDGAVFLLVPLCAAAAVFLCLPLGRALEDPLSGAAAAVLLAVSPTFLYQAVQPMSDVPVTAFWLAALVVGYRPGTWNAAAAGLLASIAILIRPNLAPLAGIVAAAVAAGDPGAWTRRAAIAICATIPAAIALAVIQDVRYGSPLASGYGSARDLFSAGNVGPNVSRYTRWLTATHTPAIWLCAGSVFWIRRLQPGPRAFAWVCCAFAVAVWAAYLPYVYFRPEEWFYTRFLLPAIPIMLLLGTSTVLRLLRRFLPRAAAPLTILLVVALAAAMVVNAWRVGAFELWRQEMKYPIVGRFVRDHVPASAYVLALQHSGSIRYYAGRQTVRWDVLDPAWLDRAVDAMHAAGHDTYAVLDPEEVVAFAERFTPARQQTPGRLVPVVTIGRTRVFQVK